MSSAKWVDHSKTTRSRDYRGTTSFATAMIVGPTCFFLGILFAQFPYDFPLLWTSAPIDPTYFDQLETHLKFVYNSPPLVTRVLYIMAGIGFCGFFVKLFRPSEANVLFDGASLVLYLVGFGIYIANILKGLRTVDADIWNSPEYQEKLAQDAGDGNEPGKVMLLGREDSLKVMSASNTILALVMLGVLVLQAGQWYAELRDCEEAEKLDHHNTAGGSSSPSLGSATGRKYSGSSGSAHARKKQ